MIELHADDWFEIKGRGKVATFGKDSLPNDMWEPGEFLQTVVSIDGKEYLVTGVEKFAIAIPSKEERFAFGVERKHGYNLSFGLLVKEVNDE